MRVAAAFTILAAVAALASPPVCAQDRANSPEGLARSAAAAWARQDARALEAMLAPAGITLRLDSQSRTGVSARQARASLEAFFGRHGGGETRVRRSAALGGDPPRGLVELDWSTAPRGSSEPLAYVIFLGLLRGDDERWRVVEIRVVP